MPYKVLKPLPVGNGEVIPSGTIVDAEGWRNVRTLVASRWITPIMDAIPSTPVEETVKQTKTYSSRKKKVIDNEHQ